MFCTLEEQAKKIDLQVNESKIKYMKIYRQIEEDEGIRIYIQVIQLRMCFIDLARNAYKAKKI